MVPVQAWVAPANLANKWEEFNRKLQERIDRGFTFLKMDVGIGLLRGIPGTVSAPGGALETRNVMHPFTGIRLTDKGIQILCEYVETVREIIGYEIPIAVDHFGHIGIEDCIRLGRALEKYNLAWLEDMVPWQFTDQYVRLSNSCATPICTGEDIYCKEEFIKLVQEMPLERLHKELRKQASKKFRELNIPRLSNISDKIELLRDSDWFFS